MLLVRWNSHNLLFWGVGSGFLFVCCLVLFFTQNLYFIFSKKTYGCKCWNPITELTSPHRCAFSKPGYWLPTSYVISFAFPMFRKLEWLVRGDCSFVIYWWNIWPLQFKLRCPGRIIEIHVAHYSLFKCFVGNSFLLFFFAIVLSVIQRFTPSDYPLLVSSNFR